MVAILVATSKLILASSPTKLRSYQHTHPTVFDSLPAKSLPVQALL